MAKIENNQTRLELLQGTLDMLILRTLQWGTRTWARNRPDDQEQFG